MPQPELNQLELQFLLLNDFRLVISAEEMQRYAEQLIVFSESSSSGGLSPPQPPSQESQPRPSAAPSSPSRTNGIASGVVGASMQAMGAIDAYGGRIASDESFQSASAAHPAATSSTSASLSSARTPSGAYHYNNKTPSVRPQIPASYARASEPEPEADTDTETDAGTEGGWTTDDEPTIRPGQASRSTSGAETESESDCASLHSTATEDGDDDDVKGGGREVEIEIEGEGRGERTPEQKGREDYAMASP